jgi:hypothetical protein
MARQLARDFVDRIPGARQSWPLRQATAWRERRAWRQYPRRMASWYRDMPDLHTRLFVSNLEVPEAPQLTREVTALVRLFDPEGTEVASRRFTIPRTASLILELGELLPTGLRNHLASGQLIVDFEAAQLGSSRAYLHWYNDHSLTSTHEKFGLTIPAVGGFWTVPDVHDSDDYQVHLAVTNLDQHRYVSGLTLKDDEGHALSAQLEVPPNGSRFVRLGEVFADMSAFLHDQPGVLYFGNNRQPAMYYYFVRNQRLGTWRAQHL